MPLIGDYEPSTQQWVRDQVEQYEGSGGTEGTTMRGRPVVILTTIGAASGKLRKTPLMRVEHDGALCRGGLAGRGAQAPVLVLQPGRPSAVELQDGPVRRDMIARELAGEEKALWWERAVAAWPDYAGYQTKTDRADPGVRAGARCRLTAAVPHSGAAVGAASPEVGGGDALGHRHLPRVGDQLAQLSLVDRGKPDPHPAGTARPTRIGIRNVSGSAATSAARSSRGKPNPISVSSADSETKTIRPTRNLTQSRTSAS